LGGSEDRKKWFARSANTHLIDDETVAKMGHPNCGYSDLGHPSDLNYWLADHPGVGKTGAASVHAKC
jgi:hypothetical protein